MVAIAIALLWSLHLAAGEAPAQCTQPVRTVKKTTVYSRAPTFSTGSGWRLGAPIKELPAGTNVTICERIKVGLFFDKKPWGRIEYEGNKTGWVYLGDVVTTQSAPSSMVPPIIVRAAYLSTASAAVADVDRDDREALPSRTTFHLYALSFLAVVLGMFGKVAYDELDTGREVPVRNCLNPRKCLKAMLIAPVIYLGFLYVGDFSTHGELRTIVIAMCLAFQNGFSGRQPCQRRCNKVLSWLMNNDKLISRRAAHEGGAAINLKTAQALSPRLSSSSAPSQAA
jgi:hypothetical protein